MSRTTKLAMFTGVLVAGLVAGPATAGANADCAWRPTVLPVPVDGPASKAVAASADGWLAGFARVPDRRQPSVPVVWRDGEATPLEAPFGQDVTVEGINASGAVVGNIRPTGFSHAVVYRDGAWHRLPESEGSAAAMDINVRGEIVGADYLSDRNRLVVWAAGDLTPPREYLPPAGEIVTGNSAIDDDGSIVGETVANGVYRAYVWATTSSRVQLTPLIADGDVVVKGFRNGRIVGEAEGPGGTVVAAQWDTGGGLVRTFPGRGFVLAVNREGWVLGMAKPYDGAPLVWRYDEAAVKLPIPDGYREIDAYAMNNSQVGGAALRISDQLVSAVSWERSCS